MGEQGWRSGESTRLPPMSPGFDSRSRRHMWVEFVVGSRPCSEGFSPGPQVFLPQQKPTFSNSNSTCGNNGGKSHFVDSTEIPIYLFIFGKFLKFVNMIFRTTPLKGIHCTRGVLYIVYKPLSPVGKPSVTNSSYVRLCCLLCLLRSNTAFLYTRCGLPGLVQPLWKIRLVFNTGSM